jgi:ABC-2 type transport system ATP-binding protein
MAIEAESLVKTYPRGVRALDGVSFGVAAGSVFGLVGPNGAGKSTTVKILTTLSRPDSGAAEVAGIDVLRRPDDVRRAIGCVTQKSAVDVHASGRENLLLQGRLYNMGGRELSKRVDTMLERFGLADAARRVTSTYSGGMQRKLDVAMGLVHKPQVLFLDEPTTGLDPESRADMWGEIARLTAEEGLTILLTTHYLEEADKLARRLSIVDEGRVVAEGSPDELKGELKGDAVHVELASGEAGRAIEALAPLADVRDVTLEDGRLLHLHADNGAQAVPVILQALEAGGVNVASVTVARPSLDDVYLKYTGRSFEKAEATAAEVNR